MVSKLPSRVSIRNIGFKFTILGFSHKPGFKVINIHVGLLKILITRPKVIDLIALFVLYF